MKEENQSIRKKLATAKDEERKRFGINKYVSDNNAIKFYTGLPVYESFMALDNFVKPKDGYQLNYRNCTKDNIRKDATCSKRGRTRALSDADELFLTLSRLGLNLLEDYLHFRYDISVTSVSEIFLTWMDRLDCCLNALDQIPRLKQGLRQLLPESFKGHFEDIDLIIDCTEIFTEKPSDPIAQSETWSEYKEHNTGKVQVDLSPVGFLRFVSDVYPGSISDDDIKIGKRGILSLARGGKRWLADKGW